MTVVGAVLRVADPHFSEVVKTLESLTGVSTLELCEAGKLAVVIQAEDAEQASQILQGPIKAVPGVLGSWPVCVYNFDSPLNLRSQGEELGK